MFLLQNELLLMTRYVPAIVNELVEGPAPASGLVTDFNPDASS